MILSLHEGNDWKHHGPALVSARGRSGGGTSSDTRIPGDTQAQEAMRNAFPRRDRVRQPGPLRPGRNRIASRSQHHRALRRGFRLSRRGAQALPRREDLPGRVRDVRRRRRQDRFRERLDARPHPRAVHRRSAQARAERLWTEAPVPRPRRKPRCSASRCREEGRYPDGDSDRRLAVRPQDGRRHKSRLDRRNQPRVAFLDAASRAEPVKIPLAARICASPGNARLEALARSCEMAPICRRLLPSGGLAHVEGFRHVLARRPRATPHEPGVARHAARRHSSRVCHGRDLGRRLDSRATRAVLADDVACHMDFPRHQGERHEAVRGGMVRRLWQCRLPA